MNYDSFYLQFLLQAFLFTEGQKFWFFLLWSTIVLLQFVTVSANLSYVITLLVNKTLTTVACVIQISVFFDRNLMRAESRRVFNFGEL